MPLSKPTEFQRIHETAQSATDQLRARTHDNITSWREIVTWKIPAPASAANIDYEFFPYTVHGEIVEFRGNGKVVGGAPAVFTLVAGGVAIGSITLTNNTQVFTVAPANAAARVSPLTKLTVNGATTAGWQNVTLQAIIEPTIEAY